MRKINPSDSSGDLFQVELDELYPMILENHWIELVELYLEQVSGESPMELLELGANFIYVLFYEDFVIFF
jgi:hypothetical protein